MLGGKAYTLVVKGVLTFCITQMDDGSSVLSLDSVLSWTDGQSSSDDFEDSEVNAPMLEVIFLTLHPQHYTLNTRTSTHYTLNTTSSTHYTLNTTPSTHYTLNTTLSTLHPQHCTLSTTPSTLHPQHYTLNTTPSTLHRQHYTCNPVHPQHFTLNTLHPQPYTRYYESHSQHYTPR